MNTCHKYLTNKFHRATPILILLMFLYNVIVFIFYWSIIAVRCVSFCCTRTWISYIFVVCYFFLRSFWCRPFLKSLLNMLQCCFCFMFWFFGHKACGILAPQPGIKPTPPALEGKVLTTGPPGKSLTFYSLQCCQMSNLPEARTKVVMRVYLPPLGLNLFSFNF